jgi:hypothetical protein
VFGELFYPVWKVLEGDFCCTVIYVGPENNSSKFSFRFTITAKNKIETISTCLITRSYNGNVDEVLQPGNCIAIHYDTVKNSLLAKISCLFNWKFLDLAYQITVYLIVTRMTITLIVKITIMKVKEKNLYVHL